MLRQPDIDHPPLAMHCPCGHVLNIFHFAPFFCSVYENLIFCRSGTTNTTSGSASPSSSKPYSSTSQGTSGRRGKAERSKCWFRYKLKRRYSSPFYLQVKVFFPLKWSSLTSIQSPARRRCILFIFKIGRPRPLFRLPILGSFQTLIQFYNK